MNKNNLCVVETLSALYALQNHVEGECVYCEEDNKMYTWQENDGWQPVQLNNEGITMNLYDLNKSIISQLSPLDIKEIASKMILLDDYYNTTGNKHYMLLSKEYNYYTIFEYDAVMTMPCFSGAVCEIISNLGKVYSMELTEDKGAIELWIKPEDLDEPIVFYLFSYDTGVVYYG